ncbi:MAG: 16S rRNA processing protein RimM [Armatimonadetes bacterium]|nr:16S rRNA processing protein RimM [Armatimonadota bacterium]
MSRAGQPSPEELLVVARILRPHGIQGEIKVLPETDFPDRLLALRRAYLIHRDAVREIEVEAARFHGDFVLLKIKGIDTPEAVRAVQRAEVAVPRAEAVPLPEGTYYIRDIIGLRVTTVEGEPLGRVVEVLPSPAHDIYRVQDDAGREVLIPATREMVREIDVAGRRMVVTLPEGLREMQ